MIVNGHSRVNYYCSRECDVSGYNAAMGFSAELRQIVDSVGLRVDALAARAGLSREYVHRVLRGLEPGRRAEGQLRLALAEIAAIVSPPGGDAPAHPGLQELLADTAACHALGLTDPGDLRLSVGGVPVVITSEYAALLQLMALKANRR